MSYVAFNFGRNSIVKPEEIVIIKGPSVFVFNEKRKAIDIPTHLPEDFWELDTIIDWCKNAEKIVVYLEFTTLLKNGQEVHENIVGEVMSAKDVTERNIRRSVDDVMTKFRTVCRRLVGPQRFVKADTSGADAD